MGKWEGGRGGENGKKDQSGCVNHSKNLKEERKMLKKYKTYDIKTTEIWMITLGIQSRTHAHTLRVKTES